MCVVWMNKSMICLLLLLCSAKIKHLQHCQIVIWKVWIPTTKLTSYQRKALLFIPNYLNTSVRTITKQKFEYIISRNLFLISFKILSNKIKQNNIIITITTFRGDCSKVDVKGDVFLVGINILVPVKPTTSTFRWFTETKDLLECNTCITNNCIENIKIQ